MEKFLNEILIRGFREGYHIRSDNDIHVSNLLEFCPREFALCIKHNIKYNYNYISKIALGTLVTFEIGDRIHDAVRKKYIQQGVLAGNWECTNCNKVYFHNQYPPKCSCGCKSFKYVEIRLVSDKYGHKITGGVDAIVKHPEYYFINEIKSIKSDDKTPFEEMKEPLINHVCQLSLYLHMFPEMNLPIKVRNDFGVISYICKTQKTMPIKHFKVKRNDEFVKSVIKQLQEVKVFSKTKKIPARMCNSPLTLMARRPCKTVIACFKEK